MSSEIEKVAEFLESIGWRATNDAQWSRLHEGLPELRELLSIPPSSATPGEWVMVPREPTRKMLSHAWDECALGGEETYRDFWRAMLAAAPQPQERAGSDAGAALSNTFVQQVPDKCDRITWRGHYYHLPLTRPQPASDASGETIYDKPEPGTAAAVWHEKWRYAVDGAARLIQENESLSRALAESRAALDAIRQYGADTLSGRADGGPDDREWQRAAVLEMTRRARAAFVAAQQQDKP